MDKLSNPKILYKYESMTKYKLQGLIGAYFYYSAPKNFNDPFDCSLNTIAIKYTDEQIVEKFLRYLDIKGDTIKDPNDMFWILFKKDYISTISKKKNVMEFLRNGIDTLHNDILNKWGVVCFAEDPKNILMWGHYTDSHKGYCLGFDRQLIEKSMNDTVFYKVDYNESNEFPKLQPEHFFENDLQNNGDLNKYIESKFLAPLKSKGKD